ncbi:hypothetical protein T03_14264 [Trichinella britovi]|uniref:Integrase p58-like C-terminal domain-containing protein n=1 Tax=Trichinella britovi TaxID=45882 RepID=A0A0V1C6J7_TRIBR|nr:hypothetical protein T03_14264 [Trichinella britovi]
MTTCKYVEELAAHIRNAFAAARKHSVEEQKRQRYYYNRKAGNTNYQTHEAVWLYCPVNKGKRNMKFATPCTGPFEIIEQVSGVNYRIRSFGSPRRTQLVHVNRLKRSNSTPSRGHIAHDWCGLKKTVDWKGRQHQQWYLRGRGGSETHQRDTTITSFIEVARRDCQRSWRCNAIMISITCTSITHRRRDNAFLHKVALSRRVLTSSVVCLFTPLRVRYCFVSLFSTE